MPFLDRGYWHLVDNNRSFEKLGAYRVQDTIVPLTGNGPALPLDGTAMSLSAFEALGVLRELVPAADTDRSGGARFRPRVGEPPGAHGTNAAAQRKATTGRHPRNAAEFLQLADVGTVAPGKSADFILLDANPRDDITSTRRIRDFYLRGERVDRSAY